MVLDSVRHLVNRPKRLCKHVLKKSASEMSNLPNVAFRGDQGLCMAEWPSYASPKTIDPTKNCKVKKLHLSN